MKDIIGFSKLKLTIFFIGVLALRSISPSIAVEQYPVKKCSYWNEKTGESIDNLIDKKVRCVLEVISPNGNFGYALLLISNGKTKRVNIEYVNSQSGNHIWKIDGLSGIGMEINRNWIRGVTQDLSVTVEWSQ